MKGLHLEKIHYHQVICNGLALPISDYSVHQDIPSCCGIQSFSHPTLCVSKIFFNIFSDLCHGFSSDVNPYSFSKTGFMHITVSEQLMQYIDYAMSWKIGELWFEFWEGQSFIYIPRMKYLIKQGTTLHPSIALFFLLLVLSQIFATDEQDKQQR